MKTTLFLIFVCCLGTGIYLIVSNRAEPIRPTSIESSTKKPPSIIEKINQTGNLVIKEQKQKNENTPSDQLQQDESYKNKLARLIAEEVSQLQDQPAVEGYLDTLAARAMHQGYVSALEVEPGLIAIDQLMPTIGHEQAITMRLDFEKRMGILTDRLQGNREIGDPHEEIERLKNQIVQNIGKPQQQEDIQNYIMMADSLNNEEQIQAINDLQQLLNTIDSRR